MLNHVGTKTIETNRLILRKIEKSDIKYIFNNWANDPDNTKWVTWNTHKNISETEKIVSVWISEYKKLDCYRWIITLKTNKEIIGEIDVPTVLEQLECCEIGYILAKKWWNHGFMTESLHAVLNFLFKTVGFHRIQLKHFTKNPASGRVMTKNGLQFEGTLRKACRNNKGDWCNVCLYSILEDEFEFCQTL